MAYTPDIASTLHDRQQTYGEYPRLAELSQNLKSLVRTHPGWTRMNGAQREALEMILHKIARIVNGDPDYRDSWDDIAGYAARGTERTQ